MKTFKTCLLPVFFLSSALLLSACGGGGGDSSPTSGVNVGTNAPSMTFNISSSQVLVTTSQLSSLASGSGAPAMKGVKTDKVITFYESTPVKQTAKGAISKAASTTPLTNFFSIDASGNIVSAVSGSGNIKVMYTVTSTDGAYVYIALDPMDGDTRQLIAQQDCGIFKVKVADNTFTCLDKGYVSQGVSDWAANYQKKVGRSVKPIQLDSSGNVYYLGWKFDVSGDSIFFDSSLPPTMRKLTSSGTGSSITPDVLEIQSFLVTKDGLVVYTYYDSLNRKAGLKMYDPSSGSTNEATPQSLGLYDSWGNLFYTVDDKETLIFGVNGWSWDAADNAQGIYFTQRSKTYTGGKYKVKLNTSQYSVGGSGGYGIPIAKVVTDDGGNLYGLLPTYKCTSGANGASFNCGAFGYVFQILPHDPVLKASIRLGTETSFDWWGAMNGVDLQINKGYVYAVEKESFTTNPDAYGPRMIVKAVNMSTKKEIKMLGGTDWSTERYDIYNWKLVGDKLHFSGFNNANSTMILGEVDTIKMKTDGACSVASGCLTVKTISSVQGAAAQIQDMEAVTAQTQPAGTGKPKATFYTNSENIYSASVRFDKPMNKDSVNGGVSVVTASGPANGTNTNVMKVWLGQTLHLIADANGESNTMTGPLSYGTIYNVSVLDTAQSADGQTLDCVPPAICTGSLNTRPARGWWQSTDTEVAGITTGAIGKFALVYNQAWTGGGNWWGWTWAQNKIGLAGYGADNITLPRMQAAFSAKNKNWGGIQFDLKGKDAFGNSSTIATLYISSGYAYLSYSDSGLGWSWKETYTTWGYPAPNILDGQWAKYVVDFYDSAIRLIVTGEDGTTTTYLDVATANLALPFGYTKYGLDMWLSGTVQTSSDGNIGDVYYFDDFAVTTFDATGAASNLFTENFATASASPPTFNTRLSNVCDNTSTCIDY